VFRCSGTLDSNEQERSSSLDYGETLAQDLSYTHIFALWSALGDGSV